MSSVGHQQSLTMVSRLSLMAVSLALIVHLAVTTRITSDHGSTEPYSSEATTESKNSTCQKIINKTSGCPSEAKACVSLCCPPGVVSRGVRCVGGENSSDLPTPMIKYTDDDFVGVADTSDGEFYPVEDDPCAISWMKSSIVEDFQIFKNGSISAPRYDGGTVADFGKYCLLLQDSKSDRMYFARMCRPWIQRGYYEIFCVIISTIIMTAILTVYTIVPELQNLHGLIFRCYIASYIGCYICALVAEFTTEVKERALWFTVAELIGRCFGGSGVIWLYLMSFNIWRSFRCLRPVHGRINDEKKERIRFIWFSIFAWSSPMIIVGIVLLGIRYLPFFQDKIVADDLRQWGAGAVAAVTFLSNICLYVLTSLTIKQRKAHTSDLMDGVNRHQEVDKQWLSLYVKLFLLMGGHTIIWAFWLSWTTNATTRLMATVEVVQSSFIFVVFVWKDKVKRSLYHMFF